MWCVRYLSSYGPVCFKYKTLFLARSSYKTALSNPHNRNVSLVYESSF